MNTTGKETIEALLKEFGFEGKLGIKNLAEACYEAAIEAYKGSPDHKLIVQQAVNDAYEDLKY